MEYYIPKGDRLVCQLCAHYCSLKEGQSGLCGVNRRSGDRIENLVYGHPFALHVDPIEKKPLYHVLPGSKSFSLGTVGCNFRCPFCQNWQISQNHTIDETRFFSPEQIVSMALERGCSSIAYTYNEPTVFYPYAHDIAELAKAQGLRNLMITNGFESDETIADMRTLFDAANVDFKSFNPRYYKKELGGDLERVKHTLIAMKQAGIWVEVTTLIVPSHNDSDEELRAIARFIADELGAQTPWHVSAFHPDYKVLDIHATPQATIERAQAIAKAAGLHYCYGGNTAMAQQTHCSACGTLLIERHGMRTVLNTLEKGRCPHCHKALEGVFDD
ncbi:MAG: AmmeMemoRadiSam system radical SAM enzyme [Campylobacterales bacterium]|nr:AmmeMemoRadiSam system radical SAM enzyme [Campylobacterales bacterium]